MTIQDLQPKHVWKHFDAIRQVPRPSGREEKIRDHVLTFAKERNLEAVVDDAGNVVVRVPATPGHEDAPVVVLQSHMDMVCEKNADTDFDFLADPIQLEIDGDWMTAKGTTLGADNGVGMAAAMALADDDSVTHGPLEILITVEEETGLTGAGKLDPNLLQGKVLLNLDTEELGALYIGCAGGGDLRLTVPIKRTAAAADAAGFRVKVSGLRGGHSGMDIVEQRGNAIKVLARLVWNADRAHGVTLARIDGGGLRNAIPREAVAECVASAGKMDAVAKAINDEAAAALDELGSADPGLQVEVTPMDAAPQDVFDDASHRAILNLLMTIPHGVDTMSLDVPGLVETSNNLANIATGENDVRIETSSRSSVNSALQAMKNRIRAAATLVGAEVEEPEAYPGWKPNPDSKVVAVTREAHENVFGETPAVKAVHAGLECGIILEKYPEMDMVSFGPIIEHPHSPDERVNIPSVDKFYTLLKAVVEKLS